MVKRSWVSLITLLIILFLIPAGIYLSQKTQIFKPRAANTPSPLSQLTNDLQGTKNRNDLNAMIDISERRKFLLLQKIKSDPEGFLNEATLYQIRDSFPENVRENIERVVSMSGNIVTFHSDNYYDNRVKNQNILVQTQQDNSFKTYELYVAGNLDSTAISTVDIKEGILLGEKLVTRASNATFSFIPPVGEGVKKVAVLLVNFVNLQKEDFSASEIRNKIFRSEKSFNNYLYRNSYGKFSITGDVFGWFTIDKEAPLEGQTRPCRPTIQSIILGGNDYFNWGKLADSKARDNGIDLEKYDYIIYVFPEGVKCNDSYSAAQTISGENISSKLILGSIKPRSYIWDNQLNLKNYTHEFGHNLGLGHSGALICPQKQIDIYSRCIKNDYGDSFTPMGALGLADVEIKDNVYHYSGFEKASLNWIKREDVIDIIQSGIYTIKVLDKPGGQIARVKKSDTDEYYYIDYQQQDVLFNPVNPSQALSGIIIRVGKDIYNLTGSNNLNLKKKLIDPYIQNNIYIYPAVLFNANTFRDELNKLQIRQISRDDNSATFEVQFNLDQLPPISYPPTIPSPAKQVTQVSIVGSGTLYGQGALSCSATEPNCTSFSLNRSLLCSESGEVKNVEVRFSDNTSTLTLPLKFTSPSNSALCSSSIGEGTLDWLVPPSKNSMEAKLIIGTTVRLSWERHSRDSKYALRIDASPGYEANCQSPDICKDVSLPEYTFNIREGQPYRWWVHSVYEQLNIPNSRKESTASVNKEFRFGTLPLLDSTRSCSKYYYWTFPVRKKDDKLCFYHRTDCIDYSKYDLDPSCDFDHYTTQEDYSVKADYQSFFTPTETQIIKPSSLSASCTNGVLTASWAKVDGAINYELRGGKGLTDRPDDNAWENFPEQDKIIGRQLTSCTDTTCTHTTTVQPNASYFLWVHSRTNSGVSDATKLSSPITCISSQSNLPPVQPPSSNLPQFTEAECINGVLNISWNGAGSSYELRGGMNLTKNQILDGTTWDNGHPNSNDLVGRSLTSTSYTKNVGVSSQYYTIWIHSRSNTGVLSDRVFYPEKVYCR